MTISIALTTYNGEKYLREQMDSILSQSHQDFEVVVCDDCSSDATPRILQEYANQDSRIRFYQNIENLGFKKNFEKAMALCGGDYIALSDQDDIWLPNHLETLLSSIGSNLVCFGNASYMDQDGKDLGVQRTSERLPAILDTNKKRLIFCLYAGSFFQGATMLLRRDFLTTALPIPENVKYHDLWMAVCALALDSLAYTNRSVIRYRLHGTNASGIDIALIIKTPIPPYDNLAICSPLLAHLPQEAPYRYIVEQAQMDYDNQSNLFYRLKRLPAWIKNYSYIHTTFSKKKNLIHFVGEILFGKTSKINMQTHQFFCWIRNKIAKKS
jgi:glycosyltransferase involved in cell wall biosynthesis